MLCVLGYPRITRGIILRIVLECPRPNAESGIHIVEFATHTRDIPG